MLDIFVNNIELLGLSKEEEPVKKKGLWMLLI